MRKKQSGVSPVIGVLLLLGVTVVFITIASQSIFDSVRQSPDPSTQVEISHSKNSTNTDNVDVKITIIRNENVDSYSYIIGNKTINSIGDLKSGESYTINNIDRDQILAFRATVNGKLYVIETYQIPQES